MRISPFVALIVTAGMLSACAQPGGPGVTQGGSGMNKQDIGTAAGAIAGGVAGYQFGGGAGKAVSTVAGTLIGGYLGSQIGKSLDNADRAMAQQNAQRALETGQPGQTLPWKNTQSGNSGSFTPANYYQNASGQYCREYTQTINVGGRSEKAYGTACRQEDGSWMIVE